MNDEAKSLAEEIDDMLVDGVGEVKVDDGEVVIKEEREVAVEGEELEVEEEVEEVADESTEEVAEEEENVESVEEEVEEGEAATEEEEEVEDVVEEEEEVVVEESEELLALRQSINKIAEAALSQGVKLPDEIFEGVEVEGKEETPAAVDTTTSADTVIPAASSLEDLEILSKDMDFDKFMETPEGFVNGMREMLGRYEQMLTQRFMSAVPNIVSNQVRQVSALNKAVEDFYSENDDLLPVRSTVGAVADTITAKNPGWTMNQVMDESAKVTRRILKMPMKKVVKKKTTGKGTVIKPSFAKGRSQRNTKTVKLSKLEREMDELLDD